MQLSPSHGQIRAGTVLRFRLESDNWSGSGIRANLRRLANGGVYQPHRAQTRASARASLSVNRVEILDLNMSHSIECKRFRTSQDFSTNESDQCLILIKTVARTEEPAMEPRFLNRYPNWLRWILLLPSAFVATWIARIVIRLADLVDLFLYGTGWRWGWHVITESFAVGLPMVVAMFVAAAVAPKKKQLFFYGFGGLGIGLAVLRIAAFLVSEAGGYTDMGSFQLVTILVINALAAVIIIVGLKSAPDGLADAATSRVDEGEGETGGEPTSPFV